MTNKPTDEIDPLEGLPSCDLMLKKTGNVIGLPTPNENGSLEAIHGPEAASIRTLNLKR